MRRFLAQLLAVASCLVLPLGLVSAWLDLVVTDTDRYVDTVGPIAKQDKVQKATQRWLEDTTVRTIDTISPIPLGETARAFVAPAAAAVVASPDFERVWRAANRNVHPQVIGVLEGRTQGVGTQDGLITIELGDLVNAVLTELAGGGSLLGLELSPVDVSIPIMRSEELRDAQDAYSVAEATGLWLLAGWAGLVLLALLIAPSRRAVLGTLGYGTIAAILALGGALLWSREQVVQSALTPADARLVEAVYDVLLSDLWKVMGGLLAAGGALVLGRVVIRPRD
ncbi:MAG TPA: hypothetical protein VLI04_16625 [Nocardioidaceae bacterium]|nr:hypothetical protein [Nocardioidaceae bacterium]